MQELTGKTEADRDLPFSYLFPYLEQRGSLSFNKLLKLLTLNTV